MDWPDREQAHSYMGSQVDAGFVHDNDQLWEQGLPAITVGQPAKMLNGLAPSRAGSLLHGISSERGFRAQHRPTVGARLARDSGGSVTEDFECLGPIASKLTPTGDL